MRKDECCCSGETTTVLACSGGSNVGQITNEVAKMLDVAGLGKFFCLAGVGGHVSGMVASVEAASLSKYEYVLVTDLGIEKVHDFKLCEEDIQRVMSACLAFVNGSPRR